MVAIYKSLDYLQQGGWVMVPLGICSVVMWALIVERLRTFRQMNQGDITIPEAICALESGRVESSAMARRVRLVRNFLEQRSGHPDVDRDILKHCAMKMMPELSKSLATIAVLAAVAPLMGLLGTVLGMIQTFDVISMFGTGNAKAMASGISIALITTQTGLLVAIPGLFLSGMLNRQSLRMSTQMDEDITVLDRAIRRKALPEVECT
jgi:biopolymer transport protein ExbB